MRTLFAALVAASVLSAAEARAGGFFGRKGAVVEGAAYATPGFPGYVRGPALLTPGWPYAPQALVPAAEVLPAWGPKGYVSFAPGNDAFPYYGRSLLHPYSPWTWSALSLDRPALYYYPVLP